MKQIILTVLIVLIFPMLAFAQTTKNTNSPRETPLFDLDISGSSGNYNGSTYSELHMGLNLNFTDWLIWRNAAFKRFSSNSTQDLTGLDSSLRFTLNNKFDGGGLKFFAGPGYRWADKSDKNAIFGEAGASISLGRFSLGGGAKYLRYDKTQLDSSGLETKRDDLNYFITIAGGAGLSF
ncbi:MAG: hypothetical protein ABL930_06780 [Pseudobdellovibrio sp.]